MYVRSGPLHPWQRSKSTASLGIHSVTSSTAISSSQLTADIFIHLALKLFQPLAVRFHRLITALPQENRVFTNDFSVLRLLLDLFPVKKEHL